jgi:hypothetical protein
VLNVDEWPRSATSATNHARLICDADICRYRSAPHRLHARHRPHDFGRAHAGFADLHVGVDADHGGIERRRTRCMKAPAVAAK